MPLGSTDFVGGTSACVAGGNQIGFSKEIECVPREHSAADTDGPVAVLLSFQLHASAAFL